MKAFHEVIRSELSPKLLQDEMSARGYVMVRGLLDRAAIATALSDVTQVLSQAGWLDAEHDPRERVSAPGAACGDPDPGFKRVYQEVFNLESLHQLPHDASLRSVMKMLAGDQVLVHPKLIGRLIFPNCERLVTHAHQDYEFMGGDPRFIQCGFLCTTAQSRSVRCEFWKNRIAMGFSITRATIFMCQRSQTQR